MKKKMSGGGKAHLHLSRVEYDVNSKPPSLDLDHPGKNKAIDSLLNTSELD